MVAGAGFVVRIPQAMYAEMVAHIVAGYPNEACGMLASKDGQVVKHYQAANAAEHPDDFSIIDSEDLRRIFVDIYSYDGEDYAYYHSHPGSEAYPSPRDREFAKYNKLYYIIFSHQYYPEPPYARVFLINEDDSVIEGRIELV